MNKMRAATFLILAGLIFGALTTPLIASAAGKAALRPGHPAVGSWFGKAVQLTDGGPGTALFMSATVMADGNFLGADSLALAGPPFGPHTPAHGRWDRIGRKSITADYLFMLPSPDGPGFLGGARFRWRAEVVDKETMVGFVNVWIDPAIPEQWESLGPGEFPTIPPEARDLVLAPESFFTDPADCAPLGCLVFKFKIHRVLAPPRRAERDDDDDD